MSKSQVGARYISRQRGKMSIPKSNTLDKFERQELHRVSSNIVKRIKK